MDREKVVKALECLKDGSYCECCDYKPYDDCIKRVATDTLDLLKEQEDLGTELTNAVELIHKKNERIEKLLKEQEAVEPRKKNDGKPQPWTCWWHVCGDCGQEIEYHDRFCRWCGKLAKWE